ncbi:MAG: UPF0262 family protein, partial [Bauldia sp.]
MTGEGTSHGRLVAVEIDPASLRPVRTFIDEERAAAVRDLIADNVFDPVAMAADTFRLRLSVADGKLVLDLATEDGAPLARHILSLTPLRRVVKDYFIICEAYNRAAHGEAPVHIEAIDVGRRGLHNEGAEILKERLSPRISVDFPTARRLFTLVCSLYWKG